MNAGLKCLLRQQFCSVGLLETSATPRSALFHRCRLENILSPAADQLPGPRQSDCTSLNYLWCPHDTHTAPHLPHFELAQASLWDILSLAMRYGPSPKLYGQHTYKVRGNGWRGELQVGGGGLVSEGESRSGERSLVSKGQRQRQSNS